MSVLDVPAACLALGLIAGVLRGMFGFAAGW